MGKYYSINEFSKILGVSAQTLRNWDENGKLHLHHKYENLDLIGNAWSDSVIYDLPPQQTVKRGRAAAKGLKCW